MPRPSAATTSLSLLLALAAPGCGDKDSSTDTSSSSDGGGVGSDGADGGDGGDGTELDNGPGGSLVMVNSCAPNDGPALSLVIGLGSGCDMGAPDPTAPYVRINVFDGDFISDPLGAPATWTDNAGGNIWFAPEGSSGVSFNPSAGTVHLDSWEGADEGRPEGSAVEGWYEVVLDDGTTIGNHFSGAWCGGETMCG